MKNHKKTILLFILTICFNCAWTITDPYPKNPNIDVLNYKFEFELSDETNEIFGRASLDVRFLMEGIEHLRLDLINKSTDLEEKGMTVTSIKSLDKTLKYAHQEDVLMIQLPAPSKEKERIQIVIEYRGIPASGLKIGQNKYGDRTFFSDNWPNRGRNWLPTVDHPYDKASCEFVVTAPSHYQVVSNGLMIEETDLGDGRRLTHWKQSVPISSWLYVLGVARFAVQEVDVFDGKSIQTWVYYQDRDAGFYDFAEPTKKVLEFYSSYIGPFSYEKLANIQSNSVGGGMEAASAVLYGDRSVSGARNERWRNVVIHEIAHQWFGNSVTEYDWDDVWLSEGFATYFTLLFIEHEYGRDEFLKGLKSSKDRVDKFHEKNPAYLIVHNNLKDMSKVTSSHTYQKGSWILHMLRGVIGTEAFWAGIRSYYKKYRNSTASTDDFRREMEEASGRDLSVFFKQWLNQAGALKYSGSWEYNASTGELEISISQVQDDGSFFQMPLEIGLYFDEGKETRFEKLQLNDLEQTFTIKVEKEPKEIRIDPNTWVLMDVVDFVKK